MPDLQPQPVSADAVGTTSLADIIDALIVARENLNLGQRAAAELIGVNQSTLSAWETPTTGRRAIPAADKLLDWAHALGIDLRPVQVADEQDAYIRGWTDCADAVATAVLAALTRPDPNEGP